MWNLNRFAACKILPIPQRCLSCGSDSGSEYALCGYCFRSFVVNNTQCSCCAVPIVKAGLCGSCQQAKPSYSRIYAPYIYDYPIDQLIGCFKDQGNFAAGKVLLQLLATYLQAEPFNKGRPHLIMPIPLHWRRQWLRGFNQSVWIAQRLSTILNYPVDVTSLRRCRYAAAQKELSRKQRLKNMKASFQCSTNLEGKHIALLDDVVTTGATVEAASRCLLQSGAEKVDVWCLARTPMVR